MYTFANNRKNTKTIFTRLHISDINFEAKRFNYGIIYTSHFETQYHHISTTDYKSTEDSPLGNKKITATGFF